MLIGFSIEEPLHRMIEWLSEKYNVGINAIVLHYVKTRNGDELLSRIVIIPENVEMEKVNRKKFTIPMSDEPSNFEPEELKELLKKYLSKANLNSSRRIKNVVLPLLLKNKVVTREQIKNELVAKGEASDLRQSGLLMSVISTQFGHEWKGFLRQIIAYEYPNFSWEKDNFRLRPEYKDLVASLMQELNDPSI